jgi:hypothetical protein
MIRKAKCVAAVLSFLGCLCLVPAAGATVLFEFGTVCLANCPAVGLNPLDPIIGTIGVNDAAVAPSAIIAQTDLASFDIDVGTASFHLADLAAFVLALDPTAQVGVVYAAVALSGTNLLVISHNPLASPPEDFLLGAVGAPETVAVIGAPTFIVRIPEPASVALLALGLVLVFGVQATRNRRAS